MDKKERELIELLERAKHTENYGEYISAGNEMIGYYMEESRYQEAFDIAEDVLLLMEELNLELSEHFADTLLNAAQAYRAAGSLEQAYRYYLQALSIYEKQIPKQDYRFAGIYRDLSMLLAQMGRADEAAAYYGAALSGMGEACFMEADYQGALACYEKAAQTVKDSFGENEGYAVLCENCAAVCAVLKDGEKADAYRKIADAIRLEQELK